MSHVRAGNDLARLRKCAVSPGPLQIALQRRDEDTVWYLSHMQTANDLVRLHICTVSPEPSLIALKRRHVDEGSGKIVYTISCDLGTYCNASRERPGEPAHSGSLARAFTGCTKKKTRR